MGLLAPLSAQVKLPISCYSMPLSLVVRCDFWEVGAAGIGEDAHQVSRCFLHCDGKFRCQPITQPFAAQHVRGAGAVDSLMQRLTQSKRHGSGHISIMYCFWRCVVPDCNSGHQPVHIGRRWCP